MNRREVKAVWVSRIPDLLEARGQMLGLKRPVKYDEMAAEIGVSRQTIYSWASEDGINFLSANSVAKLERYFGVKVWNIWRLEVEGASEDESEGQLMGEAVA